MSISTDSSRVSRLGVPITEPLSVFFSRNMTLAENSGMCLNNEWSTRGGPCGAESMGPSMGATPSASVLKVVTRVSKDSGAACCGRSGTSTGYPSWAPWTRTWDMDHVQAYPAPPAERIRATATVGIDKRCLLIFWGNLTNKERTNERTMKINEHCWYVFFLVNVVSVCF